jgi:hypothetical protein
MNVDVKVSVYKMIIVPNQILMIFQPTLTQLNLTFLNFTLPNQTFLNFALPNLT